MKDSKRARLQKAINAVQSVDVWNMEPSAREQFLAGLQAALEVGEITQGMLGPIVVESRAGDENYQMAGSVAVVPISGMIFRSENVYTRWFGATAESLVQSTLTKLANDSNIAGILLYIDSPGGDAVGNAELSQQIYDLRSRKPVMAFGRGIVASAAYYIGSAASKLYLTPSTMAGSIGSMVVHQQWKPEDVKFTVVTYGENKASTSPYNELSDAGKSQLRQLVTAYGQQFENDVARNRGVSVDTVRSQFGQGMTFVGQEAVNRGLADGLANSLDEVLAMFPRPNANQNAGRVTMSSVAVPVVAAAAEIPVQQAQQIQNESTIGAGASVPVISRSGTMNKKIKAALFARDLIASVDEADDVCQRALNAFFAGRGQAAPSNENEVLAAFNGAGTATVVPSVTGGTGTANNVQQAHEREQAEAREVAARKSERERAKNIRDRAKLLNVSQEEIDNAIDGGLSVEQAVSKWLDAQTEREKPVAGGGVSMTEQGQQLFFKDAVDALAIRCGIAVEKPSAQASRWGRAGVSLDYLARNSLQLCGIRRPDFESSEDIAKAALNMEQSTLHHVLNGEDGGGPYNRPASFPNLLSALANKALDAGLERANPTYPLWTGRMAGDLPDFKPAPMVAKSTHYTMDEIADGQDYQQFALAEELTSAIQIRRYGNSFGWTPALVANDDLGAFMESMLGMGEAAEITVNGLCLSLITGNAYLLDGYQFIDDTNHFNQVTTSNGGAPSATQWNKMRLKIAAQKPVGGKGYIRQRLSVALVPPALYEGALQTFAAFGSIPEVKNPVTDATINIYRGQATVVEEPELQGYSSTKWWGLTDPNGTPAIKRGYMRGWGPGGRRETWWDPSCQTQWVALEIRVGVAVSQWRTIVENFGA